VAHQSSRVYSISLISARGWAREICRGPVRGDRLSTELGDDLDQGTAQVLALGAGQRGGHAPLQRVPLLFDRAAHGAGLVGQVQPDQPGVRRVGFADQQPGGRHPVGRLDHGRGGDLQAAGQFAGGQAVGLPEDLQEQVLPDPHAVAAHRLVRGGARQLR
jgi:hypothetical protein